MKGVSFSFIVFLVLVPCLFSAVYAQTTATLGEVAVGDVTCTNGSSSADFDTLVQCSSSIATAGTMTKAPLFVGAVTAPPYASIACDSTKVGMIQYTASLGFVGCDGSMWAPLAKKTQAIGTVMPDGSVYAGGGVYAMPCDIGMTGTAGSCTGTRTAQGWQANFNFCRDATTFGHSDWVLASGEQLHMIYTVSATAIGGFQQSSAVTYQSSSMVYGVYDFIFRFYDGLYGQGNLGTTSSAARCVRRG